MAKSGNGIANVKYIKGMVEDTLRDNIPEKIALLRLDTDFYESTKAELEVLLDKLVTGGILIVDDYGSWAGSRKAVNDYFSTNGIKGYAIFVNHFYGALLCIKTA
jgi:O-methyltransferase